jgi:hypothetical protein
LILAHCTKLRKLNLDYVYFEGEWEHINGEEIAHPESGSKSIRVLSWKQELVWIGAKKGHHVRLGVFSQKYPSLRELALETGRIYLFPPVEVKYGPGNIAPFLSFLSFQNCHLDNPEKLSRFCPNLTTLKLLDAYFSQRKLEGIPDLFPQLKELTLTTHLSMRSPLRLLPPDLGPIPSFSHLELITKHRGSLEGLDLLRFFPGLSVLRVTGSAASLFAETTATALMRICARCERLRYLYVKLRGSESNYISCLEKLECLCPVHVTLVCKLLEQY